MVTRIYEAKAWVKHISWDFKCKFGDSTCNSNQKWNNDTCQCECNVSAILTHVFVRIAGI